MNKTIIAIDGGATKTALTVLDQDGTVLFSTASTGSNYQAIGQERVQEVLTTLLSDAAAQLHDWHIDAAVFAIAGVDTNEDIEIVSQVVEQAIAASPLNIATYVVENDVEATLKGLIQHEPGALLISGTGAIAYGYKDATLIRAGGWGHRVGDEGSGYWLGQQVAQAIFKAYDGRGEPTILTELVLQQQNLTSVEQLANFLYNSSYTNARLASFGSTLQQACDKGDSAALNIAARATDELVSLASVILKRLTIIDEPFSFYLNGGVLKNNACIYKPFVEQLVTLYPNVSVTLCTEQPIYYLQQRAQLLLQQNETSV